MAWDQGWVQQCDATAGLCVKDCNSSDKPVFPDRLCWSMFSLVLPHIPMSSVFSLFSSCCFLRPHPRVKLRPGDSSFNNFSGGRQLTNGYFHSCCLVLVRTSRAHQHSSLSTRPFWYREVWWARNATSESTSSYAQTTDQRTKVQFHGIRANKWAWVDCCWQLHQCSCSREHEGTVHLADVNLHSRRIYMKVNGDRHKSRHWCSVVTNMSRMTGDIFQLEQYAN